mmetsp:Transcript_87545/g.245934  ORF Transcript_87545/g.245934 Transcript_87545/m.245934 type:complete len:237 (+) Transcript_87545:144-854(+)
MNSTLAVSRVSSAQSAGKMPDSLCKRSMRRRRKAIPDADAGPDHGTKCHLQHPLSPAGRILLQCDLGARVSVHSRFEEQSQSGVAGEACDLSRCEAGLGSGTEQRASVNLLVVLGKEMDDFPSTASSCQVSDVPAQVQLVVPQGAVKNAVRKRRAQLEKGAQDVCAAFPHRANKDPVRPAAEVPIPASFKFGVFGSCPRQCELVVDFQHHPQDLHALRSNLPEEVLVFRRSEPQQA